ncbi:hypothetical protein SUGI_0975410 [Cryptomeria japonica]|nr:hypothetical protein SUGI_0975410 [Cryptomeria japonica]
MKSDYMQLYRNRDLAIKWAEDKEKEVDDLFLQLSMAHYSLYKAKNSISIAVTPMGKENDVKIMEIKKLVEGIDELHRCETLYNDSSIPYIREIQCVDCVGNPHLEYEILNFEDQSLHERVTCSHGIADITGNEGIFQCGTSYESADDDEHSMLGEGMHETNDDTIERNKGCVNFIIINNHLLSMYEFDKPKEIDKSQVGDSVKELLVGTHDIIDKNVIVVNVVVCMGSCALDYHCNTWRMSIDRGPPYYVNRSNSRIVTNQTFRFDTLDIYCSSNYDDVSVSMFSDTHKKWDPGNVVIRGAPRVTLTFIFPMMSGVVGGSSEFEQLSLAPISVSEGHCNRFELLIDIYEDVVGMIAADWMNWCARYEHLDTWRLGDGEGITVYDRYVIVMMYDSEVDSMITDFQSGTD